jgi:hypothetical protein
MILLLIQYFRNGVAVVAKNLYRLLCKINVVMFQLITKTATEIPTRAALMALTFPKYSGARNNALAPKFFIKWPPIVLNKISHNTNKTWYFLK